MHILSLHYNIYFGIDLIGAWYQIFIFPGLGLAFLLINAVIIYLFYQKEKFLAQLLAMVTVLVELGLLASLFLITLLNL